MGSNLRLEMSFAAGVTGHTGGVGRVYFESSKDGTDDWLNGSGHDALRILGSAPDNGSLVCAGIIDLKANEHWTVGRRSATTTGLACGSHALSRPVTRKLQRRGVRAAPSLTAA
jgi:hypothetical protein